jgi:hypothetical protein
VRSIGRGLAVVVNAALFRDADCAVVLALVLEVVRWAIIEGRRKKNESDVYPADDKSGG